MMEVILEKSFTKSAKKLPKNVRISILELVNLLKENPYNSLLHTKQLTGNFEGKYSFRATREWRVIFIFESREVIRLLDVGHRKDIYQ